MGFDRVAKRKIKEKKGEAGLAKKAQQRGAGLPREEFKNEL